MRILGEREKKTARGRERERSKRERERMKMGWSGQSPMWCDMVSLYGTIPAPKLSHPWPECLWLRYQGFRTSLGHICDCRIAEVKHEDVLIYYHPLNVPLSKGRDLETIHEDTSF